MVQNYTVWVEKKAYPVVVSDEREGSLGRESGGESFCWSDIYGRGE